MKAVVIKNNFKEGLSVAGRIAGENLQLPALKNVLLETADNKLVLTTTNLEMAVKFSVSGKVLENGSVAAPASVLAGVISGISSERLNIESKKTILEIKADNCQVSINASLSDEFPLIPKIKNQEDYLELDASLLKEALGQAAAASQLSELRPELNSILVDYSLDELKFVATDSFRLAEKTIPGSQVSSKKGESFSFLLPIQTGHELLRILGEEGKIKIYHDKNQALFKTERWELFSRLLEGSFPDYKQVIPKKYGAEAVVSREEFLNGLRLSGIFSAKSNEVKIKMLENENALEVSSADNSVGGNEYLLPAKLSGSAKEISFNWKYLSDGLKALESDEILFGMNDDNKPAVIKSPKDKSYFYLVMPIFKS